MKTKEFKTIDELLVVLADKGLIISKPQRAKRLLKENSYYSLTAHKKLFYKSNERIYKIGTNFEDLFEVYMFDKNFKTIILKHLLFIEQKIKTAMCNLISSKYGINERNYLAKENFDLKNDYVEENLKKVKEQLKKFGSKNDAVMHYKNTYGHIPFWALSKCLTMGVIRDLFQIMKPADQNLIINELLERNFEQKPARKTKIMIALFADIRNMCAHDELLLGYVHRRIDIGELTEHQKIMCVRSKNGDLLQGRGDVLALLISIKYFVNRTMYNELIQELSSAINKCYKKISHSITKKEFLNYIGLPEDYEKLKVI